MSNLNELLEAMQKGGGRRRRKRDGSGPGCSQKGGVSESETSQEAIDAVAMFLRDTARDAKLALDLLAARTKAGKPLYGFSDMFALRDAANTLHNTVGWLKSHR